MNSNADYQGAFDENLILDDSSLQALDDLMSLRLSFDTGKTLSYEHRKAALQELYAQVCKYEQEIYEALHADLNKTESESFISEVWAVKSELRHHIKSLLSWMKPKRVKTPLALFGSKSYVFHQPYGRALIIVPWNYPFQLALMPLIGAISAGNTAIIKPSELTPATTKVLKKLIDCKTLHPWVRLVEAYGNEAAELVKVGHDFIFFTGSNRVGKKIAKQAAKRLTPCVLELGGKSPVIIDKTANLSIAAKRIVFAKMLNMGQTCIAPDYLIIHENLKQAFIDECEQTLKSFLGSNKLDEASTYSSCAHMISKRAYKRVASYIDEHPVLLGGACFAETRQIALTLLDLGSLSDYMQSQDYLDTKEDLPRVLKEEIFGPVMPVITYEDPRDIISFVQKMPTPLAAYFYTKDTCLRDKLNAHLDFGSGCVNDCLMQLANYRLPFGGCKNSGIGRYHGKASFECFSYTKSMVLSSHKIDIPLRYPPYNAHKLSLLKRLLGA